jgi:hypothetical protein
LPPGEAEWCLAVFLHRGVDMGLSTADEAMEESLRKRDG